jgi:hypothetical protein
MMNEAPRHEGALQLQTEASADGRRTTFEVKRKSCSTEALETLLTLQQPFRDASDLHLHFVERKTCVLFVSKEE